MTGVLTIAAALGLGTYFGYKLRRAGERLAQLINLDDVPVADAARRYQAAEIEADHLRGELYDVEQQMHALSMRRAV